MALESLIQKRPRHAACLMRQQLRLDAVNSGRLLQRLDHVREQFQLYLARVRKPPAVRHKKITNHSLAAFVDKKAVAENAAAVDGSIPWKNFRINVAQDHLCGAAVVPGKQTSPHSRFIIEQGTQVHRRKMPKVENLQGLLQSWPQYCDHVRVVELRV